MSTNFLSKMRIGLAVAAYNFLGIRRPISSQILVTKRCNMDCKMCFVYPADKREKMRYSKEPTLEEIIELIDESCRLGAQVIIPFGGEPLLRNDIGKIIKAIDERGRFCILYTNGTFVEKKIKDILLIDQLCISIDGDEETHDSIRGKGAYNNAVRALEVALEHGLVCRLHTALIPDTLRSLPHMCMLSNKYDVMLNYGSCDATAMTKAIESGFRLTREEVISFLDEYYKYKVEGVKIASPKRAIKECKRIMQQWPVADGMLSKEDARKYRGLKIPACALSFSNIYIDTDGSVYPCLPLWRKDSHPPNVYEIGLKNCWEYYANLSCHQCASIFTIEKSLFYSFQLSTLLDYLTGFQFLATRKTHLK